MYSRFKDGGMTFFLTIHLSMLQLRTTMGPADALLFQNIEYQPIATFSMLRVSLLKFMPMRIIF